MIPVLICPIISRPDLLERMIRSVDVPVDQWLIIDNGGVVEDAPGTVLRVPENLGVPTSWNLGIKATASAPWWLIVNADVAFAPSDLARLCEAMADPSPKVVNLVSGGFAAFAVNRATVERVGYFDENYHPAYCDDADYEYRCKLAGVPLIDLSGQTLHDTSSTIKDPRYGRQNERTFPENLRYFQAKWGGPQRGGETFTTPFDSGADLSEWAGDHARRVALAWR